MDSQRSVEPVLAGMREVGVEEREERGRWMGRQEEAGEDEHVKDEEEDEEEDDKVKEDEEEEGENADGRRRRKGDGALD